jgi:hypothetical protein
LTTLSSRSSLPLPPYLYSRSTFNINKHHPPMSVSAGIAPCRCRLCRFRCCLYSYYAISILFLLLVTSRCCGRGRGAGVRGSVGVACAWQQHHVTSTRLSSTTLAVWATTTATATQYSSSTLSWNDNAVSRSKRSRRIRRKCFTVLGGAFSTSSRQVSESTKYSSSTIANDVSDITEDASSVASSSNTNTTSSSRCPLEVPVLYHGLLLSSFQLGLQSPQSSAAATARRFLRNALVKCFLLHEQKFLERQLSQSAAQPGNSCCGPNAAILTRLEAVDSQVEKLQQQQQQQQSLVLPVVDNEEEDDDLWQSSLQLLYQKDTSPVSNPTTTTTSTTPTRVVLRLVYIPTAMYAVRRDSNNTPGKQRQRARADGKQRRDAIVQLLHQLFTAPPPARTTTRTLNSRVVEEGATSSSSSKNSSSSTSTSTGPSSRNRLVEIHAVTVDFDDASVKQAEISDSANSKPRSPPPMPQKRPIMQSNNQRKTTTNDVTHFPTSGMQALMSGNDGDGGWNPHLIYVDGGNTFWLYHCMQKNCTTNDNSKDDWKHLLMQQISTLSSSSSSSLCSSTVPAVYCGNSAGAIILGASMETACWKQWDDPSIVPSPSISSRRSMNKSSSSSSSSSSPASSYADWKGVPGLNLLRGTSIFPHYDEPMWSDVVQREERNLQVATTTASAAVSVPADEHFSADSTTTTTKTTAVSVQCIRDNDVICVQNGKLRLVASDTNNDSV